MSKPQFEPITPPEPGTTRYIVTVELIPAEQKVAQEPTQFYFTVTPSNTLVRRHARYYDVGYAFEVHNEAEGVLIVPKTQIRYFMALPETYDEPVPSTGSIPGAAVLQFPPRNWTGHVVGSGSAAVTNAISSVTLTPNSVTPTNVRPFFVTGMKVLQDENPTTTRAVS